MHDHSLRALCALHAANMQVSDATTALDAFIRRSCEALADEVKDLSAERRNALFVERFGSDAVRAAAVLTRVYA